MIDYLDKLVQNRKNKVENSKEISAYNEKVDLLNASISDKKKQNKKITYDSIFKDYQDFDNQDEIDKAYQAFLINNALYNVLKPMSTAFTTGQVDPRSVYFLEENRTGVNYLMSKSLSSLKRYRAYTKSKANKLQLKHRSELHT